MSEANSVQVGGTHYRAHGTHTLQHWDVVKIFNLDYFQGNVSKYLFRWRVKGGVEDLKKARHYLDKYIELAEADVADIQADAARPVVDRARRADEWRADDGGSNAWPAEPGTSAPTCSLCGAPPPNHADGCDRAALPSWRYTAPDQPLARVEGRRP